MTSLLARWCAVTAAMRGVDRALADEVLRLAVLAGVR